MLGHGAEALGHRRRPRPLPLKHTPKTDAASCTRPESDRVVRIAGRVYMATFAAAPRERNFRHRSATES